jgi:RNA polymerase sigma-70 factor, ECF subfamily
MVLDIHALFRELYLPLRRYRYRLNGDADAADDAAQEAFVRLASDRGGREQPRAWLYTVATNLVREGARTTGRRERILAAGPHTHGDVARPDEDALRAESVRRVRAVLDLLTPRDRQLLLMREEGFRHAEMAAAIGVAPASVGTLLARAGKRFAELYGTREEQ